MPNILSIWIGSSAKEFFNDIGPDTTCKRTKPSLFFFFFFFLNQFIFREDRPEVQTGRDTE